MSHNARRRQPCTNKHSGRAFLGRTTTAPPLSALLNQRLERAGCTTRYALEEAAAAGTWTASSSGDMQFNGVVVVVILRGLISRRIAAMGRRRRLRLGRL
jgi:hypothetical protein